MSVLNSSVIREPYFNFRINGNWVSEQILKRVTNLTVTNSDEQSDSARITVSDPEYLAFDSPVVVEGAEIEIYGGYVSNNVRLLKGHIAGLDPSFPSSGAPQITIVCMDESYPMSIKPENITWKKMKRSDIVLRLAKKYGFRAVITDTKEIVSSISQSDVSDASFLQTLASDVGFITYVRDGILYYHKRNLTGSPITTYWYNGGDSSLVSFRPQFIVTKDVSSQKPTVISGEISTKTKKTKTTKKTTKKTSKAHSSTKTNTTAKKPSRSKPSSLRY